MDKPEKPVYHRTCRNPLCLKDFTTKRQKQEHCSQKCRQAIYMAKRERVIAAAKEVIKQYWYKIGTLPSHENIVELQAAVCDLEGWNKDGERPSDREKPRKP